MTGGSGFPAPAVAAGHVEPVPRQVRAFLGGRVLLDTVDARYVWEWPYYPQFAVPIGDVDAGALVDEGRTETTALGTARRLGLRVDGHERPGSVWHYTSAPTPAMVDTVRVDWAAADAWFEEDEQVFGHPRNPYVRVDALRSRRTVRVELDGVVLAESPSPVLLFETGLPTRAYLDPADVDLTRLTPTGTVTRCPYKGVTAQWWAVDGTDLAWRYDHPTREAAPIAGLIAFFDELVDVVVDGVARPRPRTHLAGPR